MFCFLRHIFWCPHKNYTVRYLSIVYTIYTILLDDINYNIKVETLKSHKFVEYFSAEASFNGSIKHGIQPPKDAKLIFMGGGIIGSEAIKMGVFGTIEELFDQREYLRYQGTKACRTEAKRVRNYYSYYDSGTGQPIGFSKRPEIALHNVDISGRNDQSKLSAFTTGSGCTLSRCGTLNWENPTDFKDTFQIVFYYRI